MAMKRKFEVESDDSSVRNVKQLKLVPFPNYEADNDAVMSDVEPLYNNHHIRIPSNASSLSSTSGDSPMSTPPSSYPAFDLYPFSVSPTSSPQLPPSIGLMQPQSGFKHHGTQCSQIPKLRMACSPGLNGQRTMWCVCEQCGAISMVDSD